MQQLEQLTREARALANGDVPVDAFLPKRTGAEAEVARQMHICNACRYCEGFCAVFPAMTRRLEFGKADVHYLANLCHNCGACLHACQYAPPHDFAVNVPKAMAVVRGQTYADYAWPPMLGVLYRHNGMLLCLVLAAALGGFLMLVSTAPVAAANNASGFYSVFPHNVLVAMFTPVFLFVLLALFMGGRRWWCDVTPHTGNAPLTGAATAEAAHNVLQMTYLGGGHGEGCNNEDDAWTLWRRRAHHLTFYGFMLCFAATSVATLYHYLWGWEAPYDLPSLPKLLGVVGGVSLVLGAAGLLVLNLRRHPDQGDAAQKPMDLGFIALLLLTSASGLALWLARDTGAMRFTLAMHLGAVMALFATMPYGKLAHGVFRTLALLRNAVEKRQPNRTGLAED